MKQIRLALDSSYLIPLLCDWHEHHPRTLRSYQRWLDQGAQIVLPLHAILECYAVLTRIPAPYRLPPDIAARTIEENFSRASSIAGIAASGVWARIESLARLGIGGSRVYDALMAWCAADAGATVLLTWNQKHFAAIAPLSLEVREP